MRKEFFKRKEEIAQNEGVVDVSPEVVEKQLEATYDCMIDIHKEYVEKHASQPYIDFINANLDENASPLPGALYASLAVPHEGLERFQVVEVVEIFPTGLVQFLDPRSKKNKYMRLYADELMNYRDKKINVVDSRDIVT